MTADCLIAWSVSKNVQKIKLRNIFPHLWFIAD